MACIINQKESSKFKAIKGLYFGVEKGSQELKHISEVESGLACNCICPGCKSKLVARKGKKNEHVFAHYQTEECSSGYETSIHLFVKKIIEENGGLLIPGHYYKPNNYFITFDEVVVEKRYEDIIPDIIGYCKGRPLFIEVHVFHAVEEEKVKRIKKLNVSTLEINIRKMDFDFRNFDNDVVKDKIINSIENKVWIFNQDEERCEQLEKERTDFEKKEMETRLKNWKKRIGNKVNELHNSFIQLEEELKCKIYAPIPCDCCETGVLIPRAYAKSRGTGVSYSCTNYKSYICINSSFAGESEKEIFRKNYDGVCPICKERMTFIPGKYGMFLSCSQYPNCKGTRKVVTIDSKELQTINKKNAKDKISRFMKRNNLDRDN